MTAFLGLWWGACFALASWSLLAVTVAQGRLERRLREHVYRSSVREADPRPRASNKIL